MADIARLGFSVQTGDLADAKVKLDALVPAAQRAERATDKFNNAAAGITRNGKGAATGIMSFNGAVQQAAAGVSGMAAGALRASTAMGTVQAAAVGASSAIQVAGMAAQKYGPPTAMWEAYRASLAKVPAAANGATSSLQRLGAAANDNINRMQSTPGNIAAQFQDIGVTAAGGMAPYLIALQQGTQLSAGLQGGLGNLARAFGQLLSPISLLTIGLVGLLAYWIQSVDWYKAAAGALRLAADAMEVAAPYAAALGAVLAIAFAPQIIGAIVSMTTAIAVGLYNGIVAATGAMIAFSIANPFTAIVLAIAAVVAATYALSETFGGVFTDIIKWVKDAGNLIIQAFVWAFKSIKAVWSKLPAAMGDIAIQAVNWVIKSVQDMVNKSVETINGLLSNLPSWLGGGTNVITWRADFGQMQNQFAGAAKEVGGIVTGLAQAERGVDYIGKGLAAAGRFGKSLAGTMRGWANGLGPETKDKKNKGKTDKASEGKTDAEKQAEAFDKLRLSSEAYVRSKTAETAAVGLAAREAAVLKHQTDLTNQAIQQGIPLDDARKASIQGWAQAMADADIKLANAQGWQKLQEQMADATRDMDQQRAQLGMTADETARYKWEVVWLGDALRNLTEATPAQIEALTQWAKKQGEAAVEIERTRQQLQRMKEATDFAKDGVKGFIGDLRSGLEQGKGLFASFADAVVNVLNKVLDKLLDLAIESAFGGGDLIGTFLGSLGGVFGGGSGGFGGGSGGFGGTPPIWGGPSYSFSAGTRAAMGTVVQGRSFIDHAAGRTMIAENGAEAIMPLKRGPDGSLGVAMNDNSRGSGPQQVEVLLRVVGEEGPMFLPRVREISQDEATNTVKVGLSQYDNELPGRFRQIAGDERRDY